MCVDIYIYIEREREIMILMNIKLYYMMYCARDVREMCGRRRLREMLRRCTCATSFKEHIIITHSFTLNS